MYGRPVISWKIQCRRVADVEYKSINEHKSHYYWVTRRQQPIHCVLPLKRLNRVKKFDSLGATQKNSVKPRTRKKWRYQVHLTLLQRFAYHWGLWQFAEGIISSYIFIYLLVWYIRFALLNRVLFVFRDNPNNINRRPTSRSGPETPKRMTFVSGRMINCIRSLCSTCRSLNSSTGK